MVLAQTKEGWRVPHDLHRYYVTKEHDEFAPMCLFRLSTSDSLYTAATNIYYSAGDYT